jgi:hypothetical protein
MPPTYRVNLTPWPPRALAIHVALLKFPRPICHAELDFCHFSEAENAGLLGFFVEPRLLLTSRASPTSRKFNPKRDFAEVFAKTTFEKWQKSSSA